MKIVIISQWHKNHEKQTKARIYRSIHLSRVLRPIVILCKYWFFQQRPKKELMGSLSDASTYQVQRIAGCESFSILFCFSFVPYVRSLSFTISLIRSPVFLLSLSDFTSWQLAGHIWSVISKMSNKIMHWAHIRVPRSHKIKVA